MVQAAEVPFVLLVESHAQPAEERALLFRQPLSVIQCRQPREVAACLSAADAERRAGRWVAGFLAYEAGYGLHPKLEGVSGAPTCEHTLWLGVFDRVEQLRGEQVSGWLDRAGSAPPRVLGTRFDRSREQYELEFAAIQERLRAGDSYQVCHSLRAHFRAEGSPGALFQKLRGAQRTPYSALIDCGDYSLLSLSPELFFRKTSGSIELKPMKGTAAATADDAENERIAQAMRADEKTLAENVMIVDLLRNDVGRLARPGSVRVPELFQVERFDRVLQMTSTVRADIEPELGLRELMGALFPSGSVTGAPKIRTQQLIAELESRPRGIFCGSIGYVEPSGDACFNVAIRTLLVERSGEATLGVGSGVVVDSRSDAEYDECLLKARFLRAAD